MSELLWYVAHTRPRCEKKLVESSSREGVFSVLPCFRSIHKYRGKTVTFNKPLFPGYVFLRFEAVQRRVVVQSDYIANLLEVTDQPLFETQLEEIQRALESDAEIRLAPSIGVGTRVSIRRGPLRGMDGWVEKRFGMDVVLLRLDFIGQAAAIKVDATDLELA